MEHLMQARHCSEIFTYTNLLNAHNDPVRKELLILLFQFYTWENWGREMLDNLCQATQWQSQGLNLENSTPESTVLTNPLFYFLNRIPSIPCFRGVFPNTNNIMNSTVRKCLSSLLSIVYILSSLGLSSSVGKMKNRGVENCWRNSQRYDVPQIPDVLQPSEKLTERRACVDWEAQWNFSLEGQSALGFEEWTGFGLKVWPMPWIWDVQSHPGNCTEDQNTDVIYLLSRMQGKACLHSCGWK